MTSQLQSASPATSNRRPLAIIFFVLLMDVIGLTILIPVAPYVVAQYSNDALMVSLISVIYAAGQFVAAPLLGKLSDRVGRRPVLLACVFGSAIGYFIFGAAGALWVLFLARLIDGITGGNMSTASAYIADVSKPEERAKNFVIIGMAFGFGFIVGPAIGGALGQINIQAPAFAAGVLSLVSLALIYFFLPESLPKAARETTPMTASDLNPFGAIGAMARKPGLAVILLVSALFNFAFDGVNSISSLFIVQKFSVQPWQIGLLFVTTGIALAIVQASLVEKLVKRFGEKAMALTGLLGNMGGALLIIAAPAFWMLYPIGFVQSAITGFIWSTLATLAANKVSGREQGQLAGVTTAVASLMAVIGPLWAGTMYDTVMPSAPYWMGAIVMAIACLILVRVKTTTQQPANMRMAEYADHS